MSDSRVFYYCYDHDRPTGGQKDTYQHVDTLNKKGIEAYALHFKNEFRLTWFENKTRVIYQSDFKAIYNVARDYIVLPEDLGGRILQFPGKKVIFNKNLYYGFLPFGANQPVTYPYMSPDIVAVFAVSEHNNQHLQFAYPGAQIITVHYDIRPEVYQYRPLTKKTPKIACMLKSQNHLYTLYHMIQSRARANLNRGKEYEWIFLKEFSEEQAAETLKQSLIFIFLGVDEGLPRMPLEAMACGCIVIAYGQGPLRECLPMEYQFEPGDLIAPARFLESIMNSYPENLAKYEAIIENGRRMALVYSAERQERSVIDAWEKIMAL